MAIECGVPFGVCVVRVTAVDVQGNVVAGLNSYVTDAISEVTVSANFEEGESVPVPNGCGVSIARYKFRDTFNWFDLSFQLLRVEPALEALLLAGVDKSNYIITDGAEQVGVAFPSALEHGMDEPAVSFEFWVQNIVGSGPDSVYPWIHFCFPKTIWRKGDTTFTRTSSPIPYIGFSRTNTAWGGGPYGDGPPDDQDIREGGFWLTDIDPPTAQCGLQSVSSGS